MAAALSPAPLWLRCTSLTALAVGRNGEGDRRPGVRAHFEQLTFRRSCRRHRYVSLSARAPKLTQRNRRQRRPKFPAALTAPRTARHATPRQKTATPATARAAPARACLLYRWVMFRQTEVHGSPVEVYAVHERAVGAIRSATPLQRGPERPSVRRQSPGGRGHCLPVSDRDPVAGSPRAVRSVADSVEAAPSIRRRWHLGSRADADPCRGRRCR